LSTHLIFISNAPGLFLGPDTDNFNTVVVSFSVSVYAIIACLLHIFHMIMYFSSHYSEVYKICIWKRM